MSNFDMHMSLLSICMVIFGIDATEASESSEDEKERKSDEQRLLYHLLNGYERSVRPVRNASHAIEVRLGLTLTNIFDVDEKNQVLTTNVWLDQEWHDELLSWEPADYGMIESIRIPCDLIWLPDIVLYNNADDYTREYMRSRAMVHFDGTVFWPPPAQLRSTCKIDVTYFPFDSQRCSLKFGSWTYHGLQVDVTNRSDNVDLTNYVVSGEFQLVQVYQRRRVVKYTCCPEPYPDVTYYIHVRRKTLYYMYNVVFPCMMMSALTLLVFCLPPDSGEKIALGITVLLAFSVFVLAIAEKMPETSDSMPLIGIYLTVVMGMTSVSVVMTVMVLNFHHRGPFHQEVPSWIRWVILDKLRRILCMKLQLSQFVPAQLALLPRDRFPSNLAIGGSPRQFLSPAGTGSFDRLGDASPPTHYRYSGCDNFLDTKKCYNIINSAGRRPSKTPHCNNASWSPVSRRRKSHFIPIPMAAFEEAVSENGDCNRKYEFQKELLKTLQILVSGQETEDEYENISGEWRQVAQVIDRLLFWVFLVATTVITIALLIIMPLACHSLGIEDANETNLD